MPLVPGDRIAERYRLLEALGRGGMASVFLVEDERSGVRRVLKQLRLDGPELFEAFQREFSLLARLTHAHLIRVHDFGAWRVRSELYHYYTADWVDAVTLRDWVSTPGRDATHAVIDALKALATLHALGVRHGDVSPDNLLVRPDGSGVLIDLGCARPFDTRSDSVSGTPGFIAPELLATGQGDARADLYALGVTWKFARDVSKFPLKSELNRWALRLTETAVDARPRSAQEVLDALRVRSSPAASVQAAARRLVGRDRELSAFDAWRARCRNGAAGSRVFWLSGPSGAGSTRLLRACVALAEIDQDVLRAHGSENSPVTWLLGAAAGSSETLGSSPYPAGSVALSVKDALGAALEFAQRPEPLLLVLEDADQLEQKEHELLLAFARSLKDDGNVALLVSSHGEPEQLDAIRMAVTPLTLDALRAWTEDALSLGALNELLRTTRGLPAEIEAELAALARAPGSGEARPASGRTAAIAAALATCSAAERAQLATIVALGGEADAGVWGIDVDLLAIFLENGLLYRDAARYRIPIRTELAALAEALGPALAQAHRSIAALLDTQELPLASDVRAAELVYHTALAGDLEGAERTLRDAEALWRSSPRVFARRLGPLLRANATAELRLLAAEIALSAGEFGRTLSAVARVLCSRPNTELDVQARLFGADALIRLGRGARAERLLHRQLRESEPARVRAPALERAARARLQRGDPQAAENSARAGLELVKTGQTALALRELTGVASSYLGRIAEAEACFAALLAELGPDAPPRDRSRLLGQRAIAAFRGGRAAAAVDDHRHALELADRHGLDDLVCVSSLNLGTAQQQLGELGAALVSYQKGLRVAHAIGRESTELTLHYNLANLLAEIGDLIAAERELEALERRATPSQLLHFASPVALLRAELAVERGDLAGAEASLVSAEPSLRERGLARELAEIAVCRAEIAIERREPDAAVRQAAQALQMTEQPGAADLAIRAHATAARASLLRGEPDSTEQMERALSQAAAAGQRVLEARLATDLYRATDPSDALASERAERARRLWDRLAASLPDALREVFWSDRRRAPLDRRTRVDVIPARVSGGDAEALRRLLSLSRRVNSSLSLERVLEYAVDAAIELTGAERCFLLLDTEGSEPSIAARRPDIEGLEPPSRAIVARVLASEEPVLTTDAESDQRFNQHASIHALKLKSVLCVPVLSPTGRIGALYVDNRVQRARFEPADRDRLLALSDQVAVAVSNARLHRTLERQRAELEEQKATIERLSRAKDRELVRLREHVEKQRRTLGLRYDYSRIVGQSSAMRRVFEKLDRITDSSVNVLLQGESGTGKELVARALHANGPRRDGAFVGINCAALPENLLESELFGHVRGAFTGADRDKKGLLLEASGGTLFLDEVGDLPLSMQSKLLRVLQEREVRAVGGLRGVPLDVRLICATHRDLQAETLAGRFREDLFYRIAVVVVALPALRERVEDLPLLSRSILARLARDAGSEAPELSSDALRRLAAHPFPGNVRELENALTRAFVLRASDRIDSTELDLGARAPRRTSANRGDFEQEERARILEALGRTHWNVSLVSRQLGIPRNTLYRKIRRYGVGERQ